ncbi:MAG: HNH endonuclease [Myxococcales bacterium]|nr:HNH endonuclease [Myxococcales bacterium]
MRTLVLDKGYLPQRIVPWQDAISMLWIGKAEIVEEYDLVVRSPSVAMRMPSIVRLRRGASRAPRRIKFSRLNVFLRDGFRCQYCGAEAPMHDLTYDHVLPRSRGGRTCWENIVTSCRDCNTRKAARTPREAGMPLSREPKRPTWLPGGGGIRRGDSAVPDAWGAWLS